MLRPAPEHASNARCVTLAAEIACLLGWRDLAASLPLPGNAVGSVPGADGWCGRLSGRSSVEDVVVNGVGRRRLDLGRSRLDLEPNQVSRQPRGQPRTRGLRPWTAATSGEMVRT